MSAFDGMAFDEQGWALRPGDDPINGSDVIEVQPTSEGMQVRAGWYGPRGAFHYRAAGSLGQLRYLRKLIDEAIEFGQEIEPRRQRWVEEGGNHAND